MGPLKNDSNVNVNRFEKDKSQSTNTSQLQKKSGPLERTWNQQDKSATLSSQLEKMNIPLATQENSKAFTGTKKSEDDLKGLTPFNNEKIKVTVKEKDVALEDQKEIEKNLTSLGIKDVAAREKIKELCLQQPTLPATLEACVSAKSTWKPGEVSYHPRTIDVQKTQTEKFIIDKNGQIYISVQKAKLLGSGASKKVNEAIHLNTGNEIARLRIQLDEKTSPEIKKEMQVYDDLKDLPHVMPKPHGGLEITRKSGEGEKRVMFQEKMTEAFDVFFNPPPHEEYPSFDKKLPVLEQVAIGLSEMHKKGYVHSDVKLENVLIDKKGDAYITDFGKTVKKGEEVTEGTLDYLSPEALTALTAKAKNKELKTHANSTQDSYALGLCVLRSVDMDYEPKVINSPRTQKLTRDKDPLTHIDELMKEIAFANSQDPQLKLLEIAKGLLEIDPTKRMSCTEAAKQLSDLESTSVNQKAIEILTEEQRLDDNMDRLGITNEVARKKIRERCEISPSFSNTIKEAARQKVTNWKPGEVTYSARMRNPRTENLTTSTERFIIDKNGETYITMHNERPLGSGTSKKVRNAIQLDTGDAVALIRVRIDDEKLKELDTETQMHEVFKGLPYVMPGTTGRTDVSRKPERGEKALMFQEKMTDAYEAFFALRGKALPFNKKMQIIQQISVGLSGIHEKGYVHSDFKLENVLLDKNGIPYVADFGRMVKTGEEVSLGTRVYMAPEALEEAKFIYRKRYQEAEQEIPESLQGMDPVEKTFAHPNQDSYSLGLCLLQAADNAFELGKRDPHAYVTEKLSTTSPEDPKLQFLQIAEALLRNQPSERMSCEEAAIALKNALQTG